jgi:hypothetical protein
MDRDTIARAQRRRQADDALEFERDRERSIAEQIEVIVAEIEGPRIDEEAFARMAPEDVEAVRAILEPDGGPGPEEEWLGLAGSDEADTESDETDDETEEEIARLQQEIAASRRRQEVLERYIEALSG